MRKKCCRECAYLDVCLDLAEENDTVVDLDGVCEEYIKNAVLREKSANGELRNYVMTCIDCLQTFTHAQVKYCHLVISDEYGDCNVTIVGREDD